MSHILAVFGATGQQGSSVINHVLQDAELSSKFAIRAITRDATSPKALGLPKGVEAVQADVQDPTSLAAALKGVHTVFAMTVPSYGPDRVDVEYNQAKNIADAAVAQGVSSIIFSTLPFITQISGGRYTKVTSFDAKAAAEQYIRRLSIKSAFVSPGFFMENFGAQPFLAPRKKEDGTYVFARHMSPTTQWPLLDAVGDTGKFVGAILSRPEEFEGKTLACAERMYSLQEITEILSKKTGKKIVYERVTEEEFRKSLAGLPDALLDMLAEGYVALEEFGYYGPGGEEQVVLAKEQVEGVVKGKLSSFEEFLERKPLVLE